MVAMFQPGPPMEAIPGKLTDTLEQSHDDGDGIPQPKRRGRPPKDPNAPVRPRQSRTANREKQVGGLLVMVNMPVMMFAPRDALDEKEIELLAKAIDAQAKQSRLFEKYLDAALAASSGGQLITVAAIIAGRRLSRHGILLPPEADNMLGNMIGSVQITTPEVSADV